MRSEALLFGAKMCRISDVSADITSAIGLFWINAVTITPVCTGGSYSETSGSASNSSIVDGAADVEAGDDAEPDAVAAGPDLPVNAGVSAAAVGGGAYCCRDAAVGAPATANCFGWNPAGPRAAEPEPANAANPVFVS